MELCEILGDGKRGKARDDLPVRLRKFFYVFLGEAVLGQRDFLKRVANARERRVEIALKRRGVPARDGLEVFVGHGRDERRGIELRDPLVNNAVQRLFGRNGDEGCIVDDLRSVLIVLYDLFGKRSCQKLCLVLDRLLSVGAPRGRRLFVAWRSCSILRQPGLL